LKIRTIFLLPREAFGKDFGRSEFDRGWFILFDLEHWNSVLLSSPTNFQLEKRTFVQNKKEYPKCGENELY
jgi:hypothetical protein